MIVLDPPEAIQQLQSRQSMLESVAQLDLCDCGGSGIFLATMCTSIQTAEALIYIFDLGSTF